MVNEPPGQMRLPPQARRTRRVVATVAAVLAVALAVSALALAGAFGPASGQVHGHSGLFVDPRFGWTIRYPSDLQAGHFSSSGFAITDGVRVTNFQPDLQAPGNGVPSMGWLRYFPANGVALQIWFEERIPGPPPLRDSVLPLARTSFSLARPYVGGAEPEPEYASFYGDGFGFSAAVWLGPHASRASRHSIWAVLHSLRFPGLTEGTVWQHQYYVLGPASLYPTGSVTLVPLSSLPAKPSLRRSGGFYLIHAPRAFYVISQEFQSQARPYMTCAIAFARKDFQFFCPHTDLRWNRVGQPLGAKARAGSNWALQLGVATLAQDGHVLYAPDFGGLLPVDLHGSPWQ